jgi:hypothetical protein
MKRTFRQSKLRSLLLLAVLLGSVSTLHATVLQELTFEQLVTQSQLVFRGVALRGATETVDGLVYSRVWFRVDEVLRGEAPDTEFSLRFLGGDSDTASVEVAGQYLPTIGTHAVWFVRDPYDPLVNPLTGWHQGVFPINTTEAGQQLLDLSARPDLILLNAQAEPLVRKMLETGFTEAQIVARVPAYQRFPLQDFVDAIRSLGVRP